MTQAMDSYTIYRHSVESLRFAFSAIGYDNCMKELNFIKHLQDVATPSSQTQEQPEGVSVKKPEIAPETAVVAEQELESEPEHKNIVIEPPPEYSRTVPPDNIRCARIMKNGCRCSMKRANDVEVCSRHNK